MGRAVMAYTLPLLISLSVAGAFSADSVVLRGSQQQRFAAPALRKRLLVADASARSSTPSMMTTIITNTNIFLARTWGSWLTVCPRRGFPSAHGAHALTPKRRRGRPGASGGAVPLRAASKMRSLHFWTLQVGWQVWSGQHLWDPVAGALPDLLLHLRHPQE